MPLSTDSSVRSRAPTRPASARRTSSAEIKRPIASAEPGFASLMPGPSALSLARSGLIAFAIPIPTPTRVPVRSSTIGETLVPAIKPWSSSIDVSWPFESREQGGHATLSNGDQGVFRWFGALGRRLGRGKAGGQVRHAFGRLDAIEHIDRRGVDAARS